MNEQPKPELFIPRKADRRRSEAILRLAMAWYRRESGAAS